MTDQERLIREAISYEAAEAVDSRVVLASIRAKRRKARGRVFGVIGLTVAAAAAAVIVPTTIVRTTAADQTTGPQNVLLITTVDGYSSDIVLAHVAESGEVSAVGLSYWYFTEPGTRDPNRPEPAREAMRDPEKLRAKVTELTGVKADHWASVEVTALGRFATIVGGVDVCVKAVPQGGYNDNSPHLPPGRQTIAGDQVKTYFEQHGFNWTYIPQRSRDHAFWSSFAGKVNGGNIAELAREATGSIKVDQGWDVLSFAERFRGGAPVRATSLPHNPDTLNQFPNGFQLNQDQAKEFVARFFEGDDKPAIPGVRPPFAEPADECVY